ncbi:MAG: YHS domain-containing protein, partial [Novipirellula sp. JB048]
MSTSQATAVDPVCGMTVNPSDSLHSEYEEKSYFFCSAGCQAKFEADPPGVLQARAEKEAAKTQRTADPTSACCHVSGADAGSATPVPADP